MGRHATAAQKTEYLTRISYGISSREQCGPQYGIFAQNDIAIQFCWIILPYIGNILGILLTFVWGLASNLYRVLWKKKPPRNISQYIVAHAGREAARLSGLSRSAAHDLQQCAGDLMIERAEGHHLQCHSPMTYCTRHEGSRGTESERRLSAASVSRTCCRVYKGLVVVVTEIEVSW